MRKFNKVFRKSDQFKKGKDSRRNTKGRPKGSRNKFSIAELTNAIASVENRPDKKKLLVRFVEQAYKNPTVMIALMKKLLPDLKAVETTVTGFESSMSDEMAKSIRVKLRARLINAA